MKINFNKDCIFLIKISGEKTILLLKDKITGEIIEKFYSYEDEYEGIRYKHVTLKPKYRKKHVMVSNQYLLIILNLYLKNSKYFLNIKKLLKIFRKII